MYRVGDYGGFRIFEPSLDIIPASRKRTESNKRLNHEFLQTDGYGGELPMRITGSFICAHAPDYVGVPTLQWSRKQWLEAFAAMKAAGMDTIVWQASVWNELEEVYYRSEYFRGFRQWEVVEPMLEAAVESGLEVFLGGYGSVVGWSHSLDEKAIDRELERQLNCMRELLQYRELFGGIYFSPETAFVVPRNHNREKLLNRLYRDYFRQLKELAPGKQVMMSPATKFFHGYEKDFVDCWQTLFDGVPLDILAPQDSIGCGGCLLMNQQEMWRLWRQVVEELNIRLWANIELFERREFGGGEPFVAASPERVAVQIRNVAEQVEKCICWEYLYFTGNAENAEALKKQVFT